MIAVGSLATTVWLGRGLPKHRRGIYLYITVVALGLMTIGLGFSRSAVAISLVILIIGALLPIFGLIWVNVLQELVPRDLLDESRALTILVRRYCFQSGTVSRAGGRMQSAHN